MFLFRFCSVIDLICEQSVSLENLCQHNQARICNDILFIWWTCLPASSSGIVVVTATSAAAAAVAAADHHPYHDNNEEEQEEEGEGE